MNPQHLRRWSLSLCAFVMLLGCTSRKKVNPNSPLVFSEETRHAVSKHLTQAGVKGDILSVTDLGDYWNVTIDAPVVVQNNTFTLPPAYKVYKSGKVVDLDNPKGKPKK